MDGFDKWIGREDELREALIAQVKADRKVLYDRGMIIPTWQDSDYIMQKPEQKLLSRIADNGGHIPYEKDEMRQFFGFRSVVNTVAIVNSCLRQGFITNTDNILNMTHTGMIALEAAEDDSALFAGLDWV